MLTITRALNAARLCAYHAEEFSTTRGNYTSEDEHIPGRWHGRLARQWGLSDIVREEQFHRLADGRHPLTDDALVRYRRSSLYIDARGYTVKTMEHRAAWDATFSAPKSASLTALAGGDMRVAEAHRASVRVALDELERFVQTRAAGHAAETTGKWIAAVFEHESARPVDGYEAPQLHTHVVIFNVTVRHDGQTRALQERELFKTQHYATALYRSELAMRLAGLGYEIERGGNGQPEIHGYTRTYLEASSPRHRKIHERLEREGLSGAKAAEIAGYHTREPKLDVSHRDLRRRHREMTQAFGDQPDRVVEAARRREALGHYHQPQMTPQAAVTFAQAQNFERKTAVDERALLVDALKRSMGEVTVGAVQRELARRLEAGDLVTAVQPLGAAGRVFTRREKLTIEPREEQGHRRELFTHRIAPADTPRRRIQLGLSR
jgi:conjugative relaxase-like TrwC/TraI family protein